MKNAAAMRMATSTTTSAMTTSAVVCRFAGRPAVARAASPRASAAAGSHGDSLASSASVKSKALFQSFKIKVGAGSHPKRRWPLRQAGANRPVRCSRRGQAANLRIALPPSAAAHQLLQSPLDAPEQAHHEGYNKQHQKNEKQHFSDFDRTGGDAPEPEQRRDQRDDEEHDSVMQHDRPFRNNSDFDAAPDVAKNALRTRICSRQRKRRAKRQRGVL